jgi:uncharacterized protein (DUF1778 family)
MTAQDLAQSAARRLSEDERITARFPADVADGIREIARINERSVSAEIVRAVREHVRRERTGT